MAYTDSKNNKTLTAPKTNPDPEFVMPETQASPAEMADPAASNVPLLSTDKTDKTDSDPSTLSIPEILIIGATKARGLITSEDLARLLLPYGRGGNPPSDRSVSRWISHAVEVCPDIVRTDDGLALAGQSGPALAVPPDDSTPPTQVAHPRPDRRTAYPGGFDSQAEWCLASLLAHAKIPFARVPGGTPVRDLCPCTLDCTHSPIHPLWSVDFFLAPGLLLEMHGHSSTDTFDLKIQILTAHGWRVLVALPHHLTLDHSFDFLQAVRDAVSAAYATANEKSLRDLQKYLSSRVYRSTLQTDLDSRLSALSAAAAAASTPASTQAEKDALCARLFANAPRDANGRIIPLVIPDPAEPWNADPRGYRRPEGTPPDPYPPSEGRHPLSHHHGLPHGLALVSATFAPYGTHKGSPSISVVD